ncbi:hypothetical protein KFE25_006321 [Diacronema lutheri]|uniref:Uncharacterized protein n=1 Tax=Diacronema lutheri TaxID=2081491 RepID=A0A8J6CG85_DIALT|nr:hypothetical protein KFE25_006321 [Diacronema lutheri]
MAARSSSHAAQQIRPTSRDAGSVPTIEMCVPYVECPHLGEAGRNVLGVLLGLAMLLAGAGLVAGIVALALATSADATEVTLVVGVLLVVACPFTLIGLAFAFRVAFPTIWSTVFDWRRALSIG